MQNFLQYVVIGLGLGATYALFAQGAVLIYRGSGLVNFAQGALGTLAAYVAFLELKLKHDWPTALACIVGILVAVVVSLLFQAIVLRALRHAAAIVRVIATIGLWGLLQAVTEKRYGAANQNVDHYLPHDTFRIGGVIVQEVRIYLVVISVLVTVGLWAWTKYTRIGLAINASAQNERAVQTLGWSPNRLSAITWGLGGALAGFAAVLVAPLTGLSTTTFTIVVTVTGLGAALVGGFHSFPMTFVGGLILGLGEAFATQYKGDVEELVGTAPITGLPRAPALLVILIVLVVRGRGLPLRSHIADRLPRLGTGRINWRGLVVALVITLAILSQVGDSWSQAAYVSFTAGVMILSIVVVTGFAGQISLGQWALGGIGALIAGRLYAHADWPPELAILAGILGTIPVGLIFALPALRTRGVNLAVVTLALGYAVSEVVFANTKYHGPVIDGGTRIGRVELFGIEVDAFENPNRWAIVCLTALVLVGLIVANLRRSATGRRLVAVRTNERAAASLGISVFSVKLYAFAVASAIAGVAGILLAFRSQNIQYIEYNVFASINSVGFAVIGGLGFVLAGAYAAPNAIGGIGTRITEDWLHLGDKWDLILGSLLVFVILIVQQDGIAATAVDHARPLLKKLHLAGKRDVASELPVVAAEPVVPKVLDISGLTVRFGGVVAVNDVSFDVRPGEVVGLIGPNGAGKTTVIDAVTGFVRPSAGRLTLDGTDVSGLNAGQRARLGMRRSFQSLELFEDLTIEANIRAGASSGTKLSWITDLFWPRTEPLTSQAIAAINEFALADDLVKLPPELPYGRRRLVGIARAVASGPSIIMLDEPAAGLDESESRELAHMIRRLADEWKIGVLLVEHDVGLVMSTCDRIVVIDFGQVIASGTPNEVRDNPLVRLAYLGEGDAVEPEHVDVEDPSTSEAEVVQWTATLIECRQLRAGYGELAVVRELDLRVDSGEVVALLGPNGAGKTTTLLTLAGELTPLGGDVLWKGQVTTSPMHVRCSNGLGYLTEERSVIMNLTARENLRLADVSADDASELFPQLANLLDRRAGLLSGGEQQMLSLAAALCRKPEVLLADELSLGLAPLIVDRLLATVREAADERGVGVLLVEQHVRKALTVADRVYVMERGKIVMTGTAAEARANLAEIEAAYLSHVE